MLKFIVVSAINDEYPLAFTASVTYAILITATITRKTTNTQYMEYTQTIVKREKIL